MHMSCVALKALKRHTLPPHPVRLGLEVCPMGSGSVSFRFCWRCLARALCPGLGKLAVPPPPAPPMVGVAVVRRRHPEGNPHFWPRCGSATHTGVSIAIAEGDLFE